mgnify:CR=1 FL=1
MIGKMVRTTLSCALLFCSVFLSGQTIQINEVMASNQTTLFDEDIKDYHISKYEISTTKVKEIDGQHFVFSMQILKEKIGF